jgi:RimJ/RimL family protein N-acetyltransferase
MIELVEDQGGVVTGFVERLIPGGERGFAKASAIGYCLNGTLIGGTVFHNFDADAGVVELTTASTDPRWLTRQTLHAMFAIPFNQWGCQMVVLRVAENNTRMVRIAQRYGFDGVLIPRLAGRDQGQWIFTLTDDAWRDSRLERRRK